MNVFDLVRELPGGTLLDVRLQDHGYDRRQYRHGAPDAGIARAARKLWSSALCRLGLVSKDDKARMRAPVDQTALESAGALAQIQFIARKDDR